MKKLLLGALLLLSTVSCTVGSKSVDIKIEKYLRGVVNDPSTLEILSVGIFSDKTYKEYIEEYCNYYPEKFSLDEMEIIETLKSNQPLTTTYKVVIRSNNKLGVLVKEDVYVLTSNTDGKVITHSNGNLGLSFNQVGEFLIREINLR
jgi:hypothetical protein